MDGNYKMKLESERRHRSGMTIEDEASVELEGEGIIEIKHKRKVENCEDDYKLKSKCQYQRIADFGPGLPDQGEKFPGKGLPDQGEKFPGQDGSDKGEWDKGQKDSGQQDKGWK